MGEIDALIELRGQLDDFIAQTDYPPRDHGLDASYVCYNIARAPMCFDFLVWLVDQEMIRLRESAPAPLKVGIWRASASYKTESDHWIDRVYRPAMELFGAVEDERAVFGRQKHLYTPRDIVRAARAGEAVPRYRAPQTLCDGAVTITLREADYYPQRNSRTTEWYRLALVLKERGERIIFVRDTAKAYEQIAGFDVLPVASMDLRVRSALYAGAKMNFFVSNGPAALAAFSDWHYITFIPPVEDYLPGTNTFWKESADIQPGEQWPWASDKQKLVWTHDIFENIIRAWDAAFS